MGVACSPGSFTSDMVPANGFSKAVKDGQVLGPWRKVLALGLWSVIWGLNQWTFSFSVSNSFK